MPATLRVGAQPPQQNPMANDYVIEADLAVGTLPEVLALWVRNLHGHDDLSAGAKAESGYLKNPAAPGVLLTLRHGAEQPVCGAQGLHPRRLHLGNSSLLAAGLADFAVDLAHRSVGPALMLTRQAVQLGRARFDLLYGLPNQKAQGVCLRAGLRKLGTFQRHAKLLRSHLALRRKLPGLAAVLLAPLADTCLRLLDTWMQWRLPRRLHLRDTTWDAAALDALWTQRPRDLLLSERSAAMLRWRYDQPGRGAWVISLASTVAGQNAGYVVWRRDADLVEVGDFFTIEPARDTAALLLALARRLRCDGAASMTLAFFGRQSVVTGLAQAGLVPRPEQTALLKAPSPDRPDLDNAQNWYLTGFDNDAD